MKELSKNGVRIREFTAEDIENKVKWINDSENNRYLHYDIPLQVDKTLMWFQNKAQNRLDCIIEHENTPVGLIGLIGIDNVHKKAEFYVSLGGGYKHRGFATAATGLILDYAFGELGLLKVYLNVDEENEAARRLYEKTGFNLEGLFVRDMFHNGKFINRCRYAIFSEEWLKL